MLRFIKGRLLPPLPPLHPLHPVGLRSPRARRQ